MRQTDHKKGDIKLRLYKNYAKFYFAFIWRLM